MNSEKREHDEKEKDEEEEAIPPSCDLDCLETGMGTGEQQQEYPARNAHDEDSHLSTGQPEQQSDVSITNATLVIDIPWPPEDYQASISPRSAFRSQQQSCDICLDDQITDRTELEICRHAYCRNCLVEHCNVSLRQFPVFCPHRTCRTAITTKQLHQLLPTDSFQEHLKHYWLKMENNNKNHRNISNRSNNFHECPVCSVLLQGGGDADFTCPSCHTISCRIHGRAHAGILCRDFKTTAGARSWEETEQILELWTKPCSHCGVSLQKAAGCDHIVCLGCQQDMCWKCGTHEYLTGKIIRHCSKCNRDYRDHRHDRSYRFRLCLILPILVPFMLLYMAIAAALCIATGCFVCCFQCGHCLDPMEGSEAVRVKFGWTHGVGATLFLLLLPVIALLEDCGLHVAMIDSLFPELAGEETEIPVLRSMGDDTGDDGETSV